MPHPKRPKLNARQRTDTAKKYGKVKKMNKLIQDMADEALSPTKRWTLLTEEMKEIIIYRCYGGDTVKNVCKELGIDSAIVYMAAFKGRDDFGDRLREAREHGQHHLVDTMLETPFRTDLNSQDKRLLFDACKFVAKTRNRKDYGDKVELSGEVNTTTSLPAWMMGGPLIEGEVIEPEKLEDNSSDTGVPIEVDEKSTVERSKPDTEE